MISDRRSPGTSPAIRSISWSNTGVAGTTVKSLLNVSDSTNCTGGVGLVAGNWTALPDVYLPQSGCGSMTLHTVYDIYDRKDNLVRADCVSDNVLELSPAYGNAYTLKLMVKPTYLYVLSDGDLDSPDIELTVE